MLLSKRALQFHDVITEKLKDTYETIEESIAKVLCLSSGLGNIYVKIQ